MVIGTLTVRLAIYGATSLKDKRRVVKSLKDRIRNKFNASIAETGALDTCRSAILTAAVVANDMQFVERCLQQILNYINVNPNATLIDFDMDTR